MKKKIQNKKATTGNDWQIFKVLLDSKLEFC